MRGTVVAVTLYLKIMATDVIRIAQARITSTRTRLTAIYFVTFVALGLTTGSLGPTLPALATQTHSSLSGISYLFTFRSLGYVIGSLQSGKLFDSHSGNSVMSTMLTGAAITLFLVPFAAPLAAVLALMFVLGAAEAGLDVGANTLLIRVHGARVAPYMNAMHCCFGVGALIAPIIVAQITSRGGLATHSYFILAAALLPIAGLILRQPAPSGAVREEVVGQTNENPLVFGLALFLLLYVGAEVGFAGWIFSYVITTRLGEIATAAYLTSLFWGSLTLGRALAIPIAARVKPETLLTGSLSGALLSLVLMLFIEHSMLGISIATAGLGLSMASIFPSTLSFAGRRMRISGRTTGWFVVGSSLGATSIPLAIGQLLNLIGPRAVILIPALTLLIAGAVFTVIKSKLRILNRGFYERNEN